MHQQSTYFNWSTASNVCRHHNDNYTILILNYLVHFFKLPAAQQRYLPSIFLIDYSSLKLDVICTMNQYSILLAQLLLEQVKVYWGRKKWVVVNLRVSFSSIVGSWLHTRVCIKAKLGGNEIQVRLSAKRKGSFRYTGTEIGINLTSFPSNNFWGAKRVAS